MKTKNFNSRLLKCILLFLTLTFWNCQEEVHEISDPAIMGLQIHKTVNRHQVSFEDLKVHSDKAYEVIVGLTELKKSDATSQTESSYSEEHSMYCNLDLIYHIVGDDYEQFSFPVETSESADNQFENYILILYADESFRQYVITYEYTSDERDEYIFSSIRELEGDHIFSESNVGACENLPQLTPVTVETCTFNSCSGDGAGDHSWGDRSECNCSNMANCRPPSRECSYSTQWVLSCPDGGGSNGNTGTGSNDDDTNGGGNTGGSTDGDDDDGIPVVPIIDLRPSIFADSLISTHRTWWDDRDNNVFKSLILNFLNDEDYSDIAKLWAVGQIELEVLAGDYNWSPSEGRIAGLKYTHTDHRGSLGSYYKLTDDTIVFATPFEKTLTESGDLTNKFRDTANIDPSERFYYIKIPDEGWAEMLFDPDNLSDSLETLFLLAGEEIGIMIGRYIFPIEDIKILIDGRDFDGNDVSRWQAAGFLALSIVPGGKVFKVIDDVADAVSIVIKLHGGTHVIDLAAKGLRATKGITDDIVGLFNHLNVQIARIIDGVMIVFYEGFGGNIITTGNKTTTIIGKWQNQIEHIWNYGLAKQGENIGGLNVLGDVSGSIDEMWATNKQWLDDAIARGDVIRVTADPSDVANIIFNNVDDLSFNTFDEVMTYMSGFIEGSAQWSNLSFYGKEVHRLLSNGYIFDSLSSTFKL